MGWIQISVAALIPASILFGQPGLVRAASVTYNLDNVTSSIGDITGSFEFDPSNDSFDGGSVTVTDTSDANDDFTVQLDQLNSNTSYVQFGDSGEKEVFLALDNSLESSPVTDTIKTTNDSGLYDNGGVYNVTGGEVVEAASVPEPSSILATVTAVTLGVVLRWKKRKI
jgi:hypothetical protein